MTHANKSTNKSTRIVRAGRPTEESAGDPARFHEDFGALMDELRRAARRTVGPAVTGGFDALLDDAPAAVTHALIEHVWEFAAFHVPGPAGRTVAHCAVRAGRHLPHRLRRWLAALAESHWDLYEVEGRHRGGGISVRRLHDDTIVVLDAIERDQPLVVGSVVALRLMRDDGLTAAPMGLAIESAGLGTLIRRLEVQWRGDRRHEQRDDYLRARGSAVILSHAIARHKRRVLADAPRVEPTVSLVEAAPEAADWRRLRAGFTILEDALDDLGARPSLTIEAGSAGAVDIDRCGPNLQVTLFSSMDDCRAWRDASFAGGARRAIPFWRAWRALPEELFEEDVDWLASHGFCVGQEGAVVAAGRDETGRWRDATPLVIGRLVEACRIAARRVASGVERAA
ncbi:MAG: hypothetical protein ACOCV2_10625 [Persicimonas sp.]